MRKAVTQNQNKKKVAKVKIWGVGEQLKPKMNE